LPSCFYLFPFRRKWLYEWVVFLMDKIMRNFSGSVVPEQHVPYRQLCNTKYWKLEGAINILVTFTTCSARLPVYAIIIALVTGYVCLGILIFDWHWCYCISSVSQWQYSQLTF
jgi:hypothetical protein